MYEDEDFQLLEARTSQVQVEMPWRRQPQFMDPHVTFVEKNHQLSATTSEHITAIIGKNGTGKSHLLSSIVQTFVSIEQVQQNNKRQLRDLPLEYLSYRLNDKHCTVQVERKPKHVECLVNGNPVQVTDLPLPKRVVALTISPFDKFPVPRSIRHSVKPVESSIYEYLGLRDQFGKASMESLLFRSLNNLFEEGENEALRRINIGSVFEFLGLEPFLTVIYRLRIGTRLQRMLRSGFGGDIRQYLSFSDQRNVEEFLRSDFDVQQLTHLLRLAVERTEDGFIRTTADFGLGGSLDDTFRTLQPLRRAGLLRLSGVEVKQVNGPLSNLRRASSGQRECQEFRVRACIMGTKEITHGTTERADYPG